MNCACFRPKYLPYSGNSCLGPDLADVETTFKVFSYDAVLGCDSDLSPSRKRANALIVILQSQVTENSTDKYYKKNICSVATLKLNVSFCILP